jgi:hypothetical protein
MCDYLVDTLPADAILGGEINHALTSKVAAVGFKVAL